MTRVILLLLLSAVHGNCDSLFRQVSDSLDKVLDFVAHSPIPFNVDGYFGITIAAGQLELALEHGVPKMYEKKILEQLSFMKDLIAEGKKHLRVSNELDEVFVDYFLDINKWKIKNNFSRPVLSPNKIKAIPLDRIRSSAVYLLYFRLESVNFDEEFSDQCLFDLIKSSEKSESCHVPDLCYEKMALAPEIVPGYNVSHRLLFFMISQIQGCNWEIARSKMQQFCSYMYWEANVMGDRRSGYHLGDMFMEQIVLCGLEGFGKFLQTNWMKTILQMQSPEGCFIDRKRGKREANRILHGCTDHSTGLGVALFGLYIRYLLYLV